MIKKILTIHIHFMITLLILSMTGCGSTNKNTSSPPQLIFSGNTTISGKAIISTGNLSTQSTNLASLKNNRIAGVRTFGKVLAGENSGAKVELFYLDKDGNEKATDVPAINIGHLGEYTFRSVKDGVNYIVKVSQKINAISYFSKAPVIVPKGANKIIQDVKPETTMAVTLIKERVIKKTGTLNIDPTLVKALVNIIVEEVIYMVEKGLIKIPEFKEENSGMIEETAEALGSGSKAITDATNAIENDAQKKKLEATEIITTEDAKIAIENLMLAMSEDTGGAPPKILEKSFVRMVMSKTTNNIEQIIASLNLSIIRLDPNNISVPTSTVYYIAEKVKHDLDKAIQIIRDKISADKQGTPYHGRTIHKTIAMTFAEECNATTFSGIMLTQSLEPMQIIALINMIFSDRDKEESMRNLGFRTNIWDYVLNKSGFNFDFGQNSENRVAIPFWSEVVALNWFKWFYNHNTNTNFNITQNSLKAQINFAFSDLIDGSKKITENLKVYLKDPAGNLYQMSKSPWNSDKNGTSEFSYAIEPRYNPDWEGGSNQIISINLLTQNIPATTGIYNFYAVVGSTTYDIESTNLPITSAPRIIIKNPSNNQILEVTRPILKWQIDPRDQNKLLANFSVKYRVQVHHGGWNKDQWYSVYEDWDKLFEKTNFMMPYDLAPAMPGNAFRMEEHYEARIQPVVLDKQGRAVAESEGAWVRFYIKDKKSKINTEDTKEYLYDLLDELYRKFDMYHGQGYSDSELSKMKTYLDNIAVDMHNITSKNYSTILTRLQDTPLPYKHKKDKGGELPSAEEARYMLKKHIYPFMTEQGLDAAVSTPGVKTILENYLNNNDMYGLFSYFEKNIEHAIKSISPNFFDNLQKNKENHYKNKPFIEIRGNKQLYLGNLGQNIYTEISNNLTVFYAIYNQNNQEVIVTINNWTIIKRLNDGIEIYIQEQMNNSPFQFMIKNSSMSEVYRSFPISFIVDEHKPIKLKMEVYAISSQDNHLIPINTYKRPNEVIFYKDNLKIKIYAYDITTKNLEIFLAPHINPEENSFDETSTLETMMNKQAQFSIDLSKNIIEVSIPKLTSSDYKYYDIIISLPKTNEPSHKGVLEIIVQAIKNSKGGRKGGYSPDKQKNSGPITNQFWTSLMPEYIDKQLSINLIIGDSFNSLFTSKGTNIISPISGEQGIIIIAWKKSDDTQGQPPTAIVAFKLVDEENSKLYMPSMRKFKLITSETLKNFIETKKGITVNLALEGNVEYRIGLWDRVADGPTHVIPRVFFDTNLLQQAGWLDQGN